MAVMIKDRNEFILQTSQMALQALIMAGKNAVPPEDLAAQARKYAIELWRKMRADVDQKE